MSSTGTLVTSELWYCRWQWHVSVRVCVYSGNLHWCDTVYHWWLSWITDTYLLVSMVVNICEMLEYRLVYDTDIPRGGWYLLIFIKKNINIASEFFFLGKKRFSRVRNVENLWAWTCSKKFNNAVEETFRGFLWKKFWTDFLRTLLFLTRQQPCRKKKIAVKVLENFASSNVRSDQKFNGGLDFYF